MDKLDEVAQAELRRTAKRLREVSADMGVAHVSAVRAKDNSGPDFSERINTLLAQIDSLAMDIEASAGPLPERHSTVRKQQVGVDGECDHPDCMSLTCERRRANQPLHDRAGFGG